MCTYKLEYVSRQTLQSYKIDRKHERNTRMLNEKRAMFQEKIEKATDMVNEKVRKEKEELFSRGK